MLRDKLKFLQKKMEFFERFILFRHTVSYFINKKKKENKNKKTSIQNNDVKSILLAIVYIIYYLPIA